jgi:hypothetical protein
MKLISTGMKRTKIFCGTIAIILGLVAVPLFAHHSFTAEFDQTKPIKLTGKVTKMTWANPHAWLYIDVVDSSGKTVNWALETSGANGLLRRGWRKEDLPAGTVLVVEGWQARNGSNTGNVSSVTFTDGKRLFAGTSNPNVPQ